MDANFASFTDARKCFSIRSKKVFASTGAQMLHSQHVSQLSHPGNSTVMKQCFSNRVSQFSQTTILMGLTAQFPTPTERTITTEGLPVTYVLFVNLTKYKKFVLPHVLLEIKASSKNHTDLYTRVKHSHFRPKCAKYAPIFPTKLNHTLWGPPIYSR